MKYILLTLCLTFACSGSYIGYNAQQCSNEATDTMEDIMIMEYVEWASRTDVCTSPQGHKYYYTSIDLDHSTDICEPMPNVVNIECFSNCATRYYSCFIFHEDSYVVEDVRRFGQERIIFW